MDGKPASRSTPRFDMPLAWWLAVGVLLATVSSLGVSNGRVLAASATEMPATTTPPSIEPIQTPGVTSTPAPSIEPIQTPGPTLTPAPTQEPIHAYVEAEVLVRPPGAVEGWTWLSGWVFAAAFEGANVMWAEPVTKEDQVPAIWLIELTGESARAALTIAPDEGFSVVRVRCLGGELGDQPIPAAFEGNTVSFEITRQYYATYTCAFITEQIGEPPTPGSLSVTFDPPQGRPDSKISVPETICGIYEPTVDQIWFSDRFVPQNPDGSTAFFSPEGTADIIPEPGRGNGLWHRRQRHDVRRSPGTRGRVLPVRVLFGRVRVLRAAPADVPSSRLARHGDRLSDAVRNGDSHAGAWPLFRDWSRLHDIQASQTKDPRST
jgi:hypothetical protein